MPTPDVNYLCDPSTTTAHILTTCLSVHQYNHDKATCNQHVPSEPVTILQLDPEDSVNVSNEDLDTVNVNEPIKIPLPSPENQQASDEDEEVVPDYYQIEIQRQPNIEPPPNCFDHDVVSTPCENYANDKILDCDENLGWTWPIKIEMPDQGPFTQVKGLKIDMESWKPEDFFYLMFDERMFQTIADETNSYARNQIRTIGHRMDAFQQIDRATYRMYNWKAINALDIKHFMGHVIVMSIVKKSALHSYWNKSTITSTPFFGKYMSCNKFQSILWHLHVNNTSNNSPPGCEGHDPLAQLWNVIQMAQNNFKAAYCPGSDVVVDKSMCSFYGHVKFLLYNKLKPNKFHIKLFMVSEQDTGYMISFAVCTGS